MRHKPVWVALVGLVCACSTPGGTSPSAPSAGGCQAASDAMVAAVRQTLADESLSLDDPQVRRLPDSERGFGGYPAHLLAARVVTPGGQPSTAVWALSGSASLEPIFPLNDAAAQLAATAPPQPGSQLANDLDEVAATGTAAAVAACVR